MSQSEIGELTHHAMLVAWGQFAHSIGLIQAVEDVRLQQKTVAHRPQTKILEFFVAIIAEPLDYIVREMADPAGGFHSPACRLGPAPRNLSTNVTYT